uniref:hypothetical protein n=2 Tax=Salmonella enterica TaxID=28901 RepID=UPI003AD9A104
LKVIVPPPASVVAIGAAKAEVQHIMPAVAMASTILLLRIKNMSFERMRIIAHKLKTGINAKRSAKKIKINNEGMESTGMTEPVSDCLCFQLMAGKL